MHHCCQVSVGVEEEKSSTKTSAGQQRGSAMFFKEHFPCVKTSRGESAHLLESANSGLAVSHIPLTLLHFFSSSLSVTCPDLTDRMKMGNNFSRAEGAALALCESV